MLQITPQMKVLVAVEPADFRQGIDGLARLCKPVALLGGHGASLGMRFYTGSMFPAEYKDAAFIVRHGSWNRTNKIGGDILLAKFNPDGTVKSLEPFLTGFLQDNTYVGRPVDVAQLADGSLLLSDDFNGAVYRISYAK